MSTPAEAAPSAPGRWTVLESDWAFRSRFVGIRRDRCRLPDGRQSPEFYFMELRDVCLVVALTPGGEVLLSREYKHGAGDVIATLPAGFVEPAEEPAAAARRELAEETGHAAAVLEPLGSQWLFPSFAGARAHFFLARDVRPAGAPHPDEFETIEVRAVPLAELRADGKSPAPRHLTDVCSRLGVALALARLDGGPGGRSGARA